MLHNRCIIQLASAPEIFIECHESGHQFSDGTKNRVEEYSSNWTVASPNFWVGRANFDRETRAKNPDPLIKPEKKTPALVSSRLNLTSYLLRVRSVSNAKLKVSEAV